MEAEGAGDFSCWEVRLKLDLNAELDDAQEIHYPAVMKKLAEVGYTGYTGYVGHEFIPTRDAVAGLTQAVAACTV